MPSLLFRRRRRLTTLLIRRSVALRNSDAVRHVVLVVLGLSYFSVPGKTSDQVDPGEIPSGRSGRECLRGDKGMGIDIRDEVPIGVPRLKIVLTRAWTMDAAREPALADRERKDIFVLVLLNSWIS